jgi:hypothetical protein
MERFLPKAEATQLASKDYGELFRVLFIGEPATIKERPDCKQTMYGRKTTTMRRLHDIGALKYEQVSSYLTCWFGFLKDKKAAKNKECSSSRPRSNQISLVWYQFLAKEEKSKYGSFR